MGWRRRGNVRPTRRGAIMATRDLTVGKPLPVLARFSIPVICGNLFQLFYTLADSIIVGKTIGENALAAVGATGVFVYFILCFIQGFTNGFSILLAQLFGFKDKDGVKKSIVSSTYLSIFFAIVITIPACMATGIVVRLMKVPQEISNDAYMYLFIIVAGTGATIWYNMISNILRALGDSRTPLVYLVVSSLLNIVLDILFMVPFKWGVAGAAYATVFSQLISAVLCAISAYRRFEEMHIEKAFWRLDKEILKRHFKLGFLMGFQMSVMCIGQLVMQSSVNAIGTSAIAGYTAATKVDQLSVLVNNAFGMAIASYVAQNYGAHLYGRIEQGTRASLILVLSTDIAMAILMLLVEPFVVPLFVTAPSPEVYDYARMFFQVTLPFYPILGLILIYRTSIQSMGISWAPFAACIVELAARVCASLVLSRWFGYRGIVFSSPLAWIGSDIIVVPVYYRVMKRLRQKGEGVWSTS